MGANCAAERWFEPALALACRFFATTRKAYNSMTHPPKQADWKEVEVAEN
jgi:hypothetical protein